MSGNGPQHPGTINAAAWPPTRRTRPGCLRRALCVAGRSTTTTTGWPWPTATGTPPTTATTTSVFVWSPACPFVARAAPPTGGAGVPQGNPGRRRYALGPPAALAPFRRSAGGPLFPSTQVVITADTAVRLGLAFGVEPQFWLNLQAQYDIEVLQRTQGKQLAQAVQALAA